MNWIIEDGLIKLRTDNKEIIPSTEEIFASESEIVVDEISYSFMLPNVKLSKIIAKKSKIIFNYRDGLIYIDVYINVRNRDYSVPRLNGKFVDYVIVDNVWYYSDKSINKLNEILEKNKLNCNSVISYFNYISIVNDLNFNLVEYIDNVLIEMNKIKNEPAPMTIDGLNGKLYQYQEAGVRWLSYMCDEKCGCILADEMGLGKTLQIIVTIAHSKEKKQNANHLIVAPVSLLENWKREIEKFYPSLSVVINHGSNRINYYKELLPYDVVITSYGCIQTDLSMYQMVEWDIMVLDEAQNIKNPKIKRTTNIKRINKKLGIAVSGTPFENHLTDIWSVTDFVIPKFFGSLREFETLYPDTIGAASIIEEKLSPIMIRRKVKEVANDLPEKIEISQPILMDASEAELYEAGRNSLKALKTLKLETITKLRMFCTHPSVYSDKYVNYDPISISNKYQRCCEIIEEIVTNKDKVVIFASFNGMVDLFINDLNKRFSIPVFYINGSVEASKRQDIVDRFSDVIGSAILVLNPRAAGTGLNITAANYVIHYNLEWNPSVEDQASARVYRRGQNKTVFIYRLYYNGTIEEIINEKIEKKRQLADVAVVGNQGEINEEDIERALSISPIRRSML